jgi:hypothetical protein
LEAAKVNDDIKANEPTDNAYGGIETTAAVKKSTD